MAGPGEDEHRVRRPDPASSSHHRSISRRIRQAASVRPYESRNDLIFNQRTANIDDPGSLAARHQYGQALAVGHLPR